MTALIATSILGPRKGRFHHAKTGLKLSEPNPMHGNSKSLQVSTYNRRVKLIVIHELYEFLPKFDSSHDAIYIRCSAHLFFGLVGSGLMREVR